MTTERYTEILGFLRHLDANTPGPSYEAHVGTLHAVPDIVLSGSTVRHIIRDLVQELQAHRKALEITQEALFRAHASVSNAPMELPGMGIVWCETDIQRAFRGFPPPHGFCEGCPRIKGVR